ncbi:hypothetical protein CEUSTIGMA_g3662.t1 [Chlamydomonas eustigma]|uniref:MSP domain-containing protein n=1 Tax=Chlamydomonas eustigma TaxID=1157962 RepID=A0A250WZF4_9CHLO|nr:hypothetical protein CEUSTIGMA_g3662.t1 [Chlamydomonas eustigma]|eukprot:GAX76218.1 hypothetical protein CEUSTIGMA_g3662.t1 [Chlamydomonas eustigma]
MTPEEEYLDLLYADVAPEGESARPLLVDSKVIQQASARPTYSESAHDHQFISTIKPGSGRTLSGSVRSGSNSLSPLKGAKFDMQKKLDSIIQKIESNRVIFEQCMLETSKAREQVKGMEAEIKSLEKEEEELKARKPVASERLRKVHKWIEERFTALSVQQDLLESKQMELISVEAQLRMAESELDFMADEKEVYHQSLAMDHMAESVTASKLRDWEANTAQIHVARVEAEAQRIADLGDKHNEAREKVINAAEDAQADARERLKKGLERVKRNKEKGLAVVEQQNEARRQAVIGLKNSMVAVREEVADKAMRFRQLQKQKKEMHEKDFQDLLEQGLNPYEVHRKKDVEREVARQHKAIRDNIATRQVAIAEQLALEEQVHSKEVAARESKMLDKEAFNREMGVAAQEQRTEQYMLKNTVGHKSMLDPTGHFNPDPSSVTNFKTKDFGMGGADPSLLALMTRRHPEVEPKDLLMPSKFKSSLDVRQSTSSRKVTLDEDDFDTTVPGGDTPPASPPSEGAASSGWKVLETRQLTKLEQDAMERAKERHKASIGKSKTMMGREFGGDAFMPTPAVAVFRDFEVGQVYSQKLSITNTSYDRNTYKVVQIPPEHGNVLDVSYKLPGYLATGVSADLTVKFTPKANEDIETHIEMLADTGPFFIPVRCLTKKASMSVSTPSLDFGPGVTLGESLSKTFTLSNDGALDVEYTIMENVEGGTLPGPDGKLHRDPFLVHHASGMVSGYSSITITCVLCPMTAGPARLPLHISFRAPSQRKLHVPPVDVALEGTGRDVAIFLEHSVLDFKCSMVDHTYRNYLQVRNGGRVAMKINVVNRPDVNDYFEFYPVFGFSQAGEVFPVTVIFRPRVRMMEQCARFLVDPEKGIFEIPMKLNVPDQRLPVSFTLRAQVTTTDLIFDPPRLEFGQCVVNEDTAVQLRITNPSALPQTFGFLTTAQPGIGIKPNDGFGYILPGETILRTVSFQPPIPGPQQLTITARTLAGRSFSLPCSAFGVQPDISLSHNRLAFPATPVNDMTMVSVILTNNTDRSKAFEFYVPPGSDLSFIPNVGEIPPKSNLRVQVEFAPTPDHVPEPVTSPEVVEETDVPAAKGKGAAAAKELKKVVEVEDEEDENAEEVPDLPVEEPEDPNKWYRWRQWSAVCHIQPSNRARPSSSGGTRDSSTLTGATEDGKQTQQLHINVETCAVQPDIVLRTNLPQIPDKLLYELDFGPVPVGQRITRVIELYNQGEDVAALDCDPLDSAQVFSVVNAPRPLKPGGTFKVLLSFQPQQRTRYLEMLTVHSMRTRVRVALKGLGIAPELKVEPADAITHGFDMGDVHKGESTERRFTVTNVCPFPLTFSLLFKGVPDPNLQMKPAFFARPSEGTLAQGESAEVNVVFQPSNQRPYFEDVMQVYVPNQQEELLVKVRGRCWEEGVFVSGPAYPPPPEDPFMEQQLALEAERATSIPGPATAAAAAASVRELILNFPHAVYFGEIATTSFEVGSLKSITAGGSNGEFVLDDLPAAAKEAGWHIDPTKLPLSVGDKKSIQVRYTSPLEAHAAMAAYFGHEERIELRLGATLKGGLPAPPVPEGRRVFLMFRVHLKPGARDSGWELPASVSKPAQSPTPTPLPVQTGKK